MCKKFKFYGILLITYLFTFLLMSKYVFGQLKLTPEELAFKSDVITIGEVKNIFCEWSEDNTKIYTYIKIQPIEILKGEVPEEFTIRVLGGEVGEIGLAVSHSPIFQVSEKVLIFLRKGKKNIFFVTCADRGKYTFREDKLINYEGKEISLSFIETIK